MEITKHKKTRSIATIQYDCDFLVAINHFINNGFTRPDIMSSKVLKYVCNKFGENLSMKSLVEQQLP